MRFLWLNLIDAAATVITASSENVEFPAANLKNELRGKLWKTGATVAAENVVFDFGSAKAVTAFIMLDHNMDESESAVKVEANTTNSWGAPAFTQSLSGFAGTVAHITTFSQQTYRYWRFSFVKPSAGVTRQFGRLFLGTYFDSAAAPDFTGFSRKRRDLSIKQQSVGGQIYTDERSHPRMFKLDIPHAPQADITQLDTIFNSLGIAKSLFFTILPGESGEPGELLYVKHAKEPEPAVSGFDSTLHYDYQLELEEAL